MNIRQSYNIWAAQYDSNQNKTRDLEGKALQTSLSSISFSICLEIGCGTGKNTGWLLQKAKKVTAVDISDEMLARAREKITASNVQFIQADITQPWNFDHNHYNLVSFSLVLEHIQHLGLVLKEASLALKPNGYVYIGELHPFKQYTGTKARFDTAEGRHVVECYTHHLSDFVQAALENNLSVVEIKEHFDNDDLTTIPRILTILLQKVL